MKHKSYCAGILGGIGLGFLLAYYFQARHLNIDMHEMRLLGFLFIGTGALLRIFWIKE